MAIYPTRDFILLWRAKVDQNIDWKREAKEDKKTNAREKKQRSPLRLINHHKTHTYTLYIYLKHHGHHVREIVPAPLFEEGNAHFDGASRKRSGFSVVCLSGFFLSLSFFLVPREFVRSFVFVGEKEERGRGEIFESRWFLRARCVPPQRAALGCEARAWENETRLCARNMNASFDRIGSRGKDVEPTANLVGSFSKRLQHGGVPLSPKNFGSLLRETFFESIAALTLISLFLL